MDWQLRSADHGSLPPQQRKSGTFLGNIGANGNILLSSLLAGAAVALFGLGLDYFLVHEERFRSFTASLVLNVVFGIFVAVLVNRLLAHEHEKRARVLGRLAVIDEMNHHIRNALQVIAFKTVSSPNAAEVAEITRAVDRIQWSLREVLPRVEPEFTSFEGSARKEAESESFREEQRKHRS
jgi:hypothetical protein